MKYTIISINPGVDEFRYYTSEDEYLSGRAPLRIERKSGSKGANCAIALSKLGAKVDYFTVGRGEFDVDSFFDGYDGITIHRTVTESRERLNVKIIFPSDDGINAMIEKNEKGGPLTENESKAFFDSIIDHAKNEKLCVGFSTYIFTGSLPLGVEKSEYLCCISEISELGAYTVLDGKGELISALRGKFPSLIKPNRDEFRDLCRNVEKLKSFQHDVENSALSLETMLKISRTAVENFGCDILLTLGELGFVYASIAEESFIHKSKPLPLTYPAGMGDNLLSAFLYYRMSKKLSPKEAAKKAVSFAESYGMNTL